MCHFLYSLPKVPATRLDNIQISNSSAQKVPVIFRRCCCSCSLMIDVAKFVARFPSLHGQKAIVNEAHLLWLAFYSTSMGCSYDLPCFQEKKWLTKCKRNLRSKQEIVRTCSDREELACLLFILLSRGPIYQRKLQ